MLNELLGLMAALTLRLTYLQPEPEGKVPEVDLPPFNLEVLDRKAQEEGEAQVA